MVCPHSTAWSRLAPSRTVVAGKTCKRARACLLPKRGTDRGPWLHGNYPASQLLRPHPTSEPIPGCGYGFPLGVGARPPTSSDLSVPICPFRHVPSPLTPESPSAAFIRCFTDGAGFVYLDCLATLDECNEADLGSLSVTAHVFANPGLRRHGLLPTTPG